jgi:competence protein ComEA
MGIAAGDASGRLININTATAEELDTLPEIGPARAAAIVAYRDANGPFVSVDELVNVDGISDRIVELIRPFVTVGP